MSYYGRILDIMKYIVGFGTSVGIKKNINQDALCIKKAVVGDGEILLTLVCDGMGGLAKGELASATVINRFSEWFERELPLMINDLTTERVKNTWNQIVHDLNQKLWNYGKNNYTQLGTTLTAVLFLEDGTYVTAQVGDTRQYKINEETIEQITEDQTFVAREIKRGNMTYEQAMNDPRRNVLLQCIGASGNVEPEFYEGKVESGDNMLLCSDGFRHVVSKEEIREKIYMQSLDSESQISLVLGEIIKIVESREEKDNITALLIKTL